MGEKMPLHLNDTQDTQWVQHFKELLTERRDKFNVSKDPIQATERVTLNIEDVKKTMKNTNLLRPKRSEISELYSNDA